MWIMVIDCWCFLCGGLIKLRVAGMKWERCGSWEGDFSLMVGEV